MGRGGGGGGCRAATWSVPADSEPHEDVDEEHHEALPTPNPTPLENPGGPIDACCDASYWAISEAPR